jgi:hypothetical protein
LQTLYSIWKCLIIQSSVLLLLSKLPIVGVSIMCCESWVYFRLKNQKTLQNRNPNITHRLWKQASTFYLIPPLQRMWEKSRKKISIIILMPCHKSQNAMKIYNLTWDYHGAHSHACHNANCYICMKVECIINNTINIFFLF